MNPIVFPLAGTEHHAERLARQLEAELGTVEVRRFPDGESWVRIESECTDREAVVVADLTRPDAMTCPLIFAARTLAEMGASRIGLVAPYLAYMRQDERFAPGEAVTSRHFAELMSGYFDWLVTLDPHLHRHSSLADIYQIPTRVAHAADAIAEWVAGTCERPLVIGPDDESRQWVEPVASRLDAPQVVFSKTRRGDRHVEVEASGLQAHRSHQPVILDDIISTGATMVETIEAIVAEGLEAPICIGIHGLFADGAASALEKAGAHSVVTCNGVRHPTNGIDVVSTLAEATRDALLRESVDAAE